MNHMSVRVISSASQATQSAEKTGRKLGNQVIRKGYMSIHNLGIMKGGKSNNQLFLSGYQSSPIQRWTKRLVPGCENSIELESSMNG